ncbi:MAG: hypothetical protein LBQ60_16160 [Bacteroidales bacterium]|jgi:hypothetical protein|nr:hypothetical protein [Bacteroidales bacterium]
MKRVILLLIVVSSVTEFYAQCNLPYKPFASFKGDTVEYLYYNFTARLACYKGKKVSDVFNDLELPVTYIVGGSRIIAVDGDGGTNAFYLGIHQVGPIPSEIIDYYIEFYPANPTSLGLNLTPGTRWTQQMYEVIKDLELKSVGFNQNFPRGRDDILKKVKEIQKREMEQKKAKDKANSNSH